MAGGWRISEAEELTALRKARRDARTLRTEEAWNRFARQVARCEHLGLLNDEDVDEPSSVSHEVEAAGRGDPPAPSGDTPGSAAPARRFATAD